MLEHVNDKKKNEKKNEKKKVINGVRLYIIQAWGNNCEEESNNIYEVMRTLTNNFATYTRGCRRNIDIVRNRFLAKCLWHLA